ncbi:MAG: TonB-dependent receptor, partial [Saprospiraceae bacterium]|nr:TonB-dependent receptor [Saprospiraceae bacterium]
TWRPSLDARLKLSYGQLQQNQHVISTLDNAYPSELSVPATLNTPPQRADIVDLEWRHTLEQTSFSIAGYYKKLHNLPAFGHNASFLSPARLDAVDATGWEEDVIIGDGHAYGIELDGRWQSGQSFVAGSYAYARSFRYFQELTSGYEIPYQFDRPHMVKILAGLQVGQQWQLGISWLYGSGNTLSLQEGSYDVWDAQDEYLYTIDVPAGDIDLHFFEPIHRLDLSIGFQVRSPTLMHQWKASISNVYNRANPAFGRTWYDEEGGFVTTQAGLPRMLQLSYVMTLTRPSDP